MTVMRTAAALVATAAALPFLAGPAAAAPVRPATVVSVVDGDTVRVRVAGRIGTIDLVGVKAPTGRQCFATESRRELRKLLPVRARIGIEDETRLRGRGRYVTRAGKLVNTDMVRRGAARLGSLTRVGRAQALRAADRSARTARRGLVARCGGGGGGGGTVTPGTPSAPGTPVPPGPAVETDGPAAQVGAMRRALEGRQLRDVRTDTNSSTENITVFCAENRTSRREQTIFRDSPEQSLLTQESGSWAVTNTARQADGSLAAEVLVRFDKSSFETRTLQLVLGADGVVRMPGRAAELSPAASPCGANAPDGTLDNDSAAARDGFLAALNGARIGAGGRDTDFCPGRVIRREGGAIAADGAPIVEWAVADPTGRIGIVRIEDATRGTSRRVLIALPAGGGAPRVGELGRGDTAATDGVRSAAVC